MIPLECFTRVPQKRSSLIIRNQTLKSISLQFLFSDDERRKNVEMGGYDIKNDDLELYKGYVKGNWLQDFQSKDNDCY